VDALDTENIETGVAVALDTCLSADEYRRSFDTTELAVEEKDLMRRG
jgi:hypothetical protein